MDTFVDLQNYAYHASNIHIKDAEQFVKYIFTSIYFNIVVIGWYIFPDKEEKYINSIYV